MPPVPVIHFDGYKRRLVLWRLASQNQGSGRSLRPTAGGQDESGPQAESLPSGTEFSHTEVYSTNSMQHGGLKAGGWPKSRPHLLRVLSDLGGHQIIPVLASSVHNRLDVFAQQEALVGQARPIRRV